MVFACVSLIPRLLYTAGADFAGMYSVYLCFPAGTGFFAFVQIYLISSISGGLLLYLPLCCFLFPALDQDLVVGGRNR